MIAPAISDPSRRRAEARRATDFVGASVSAAGVMLMMVIIETTSSSARACLPSAEAVIFTCPGASATSVPRPRTTAVRGSLVAHDTGRWIARPP
jgi:hypothetical protein